MSELIPVLKEPKIKRRGNRKLLIALVLLFIILLSVLFFNSSISKISKITVTGQQFIPVTEIMEAMNIEEQDPFFSISAKGLQNRLEAMESIDRVTVTKIFPGEIQVQVLEFPPVAFELASDHSLTAILSSGTSVPVEGRNFIVDKPILSGWVTTDPVKAELGKALAGISAEILSDFSEIHSIASESYPDRIKIYTRTGFEVITAVSLLLDKAATLSAVIETQEPGRVTMLLADTYAEYNSLNSESEDSNEN